ncbi:hypothetical protein Tco_0551881 [Tanacetum coccineum]
MLREQAMTPHLKSKEYMYYYSRNQEGGYTLKQLKALSFEEVKEIFEATMRKVQSFVPMDSELEVQRLKRAGEEPKEEELSQEQLHQMMMVIPVEEVYVEALQKFDRDDLDKLWNLVKERFRTTEPTEDKARELWLYDTCGVHHVSTERGHDIYMFVEKDYALTKALATLMLCNKLRVDQYSNMADGPITEIKIIATGQTLNKYVQEKQEEKNIAEEQAAKVSSQYWKPPIFYDDDDDDDKESSIPLRDFISKLPLSVAIAPDLPITDSLIMEDEHLNTIPETESDEENESSIKDLNLTPNDDEPFSKDDVLKENFKIYSNPLFEFDEEIIYKSLLNQDTSMVSSPNIDSLLKEFSGELAHIDLIPPGIDEADFDPEDDIRLVEKFLSPHSYPVEDNDSLMEEIDIFLAPDDLIPPGIETYDYDSEGDVLFLEELLNDDSISLPEYESFHVDFYNVPSSPRPPEKPPDDDVYFDIEPNTGVLITKVVDDISDKSTREPYVRVPNVLPILPTLYPVFDTLLPFSLQKNGTKVLQSWNSHFKRGEISSSSISLRL